MAEGDTSDRESKTEAPTPQKLRKAREQGDVPISRETGTMMSVFALFAITVFLLPQIASRITIGLSGIFADAGQITIGDGHAGVVDTGKVLSALGTTLAWPLLPVFGTLLLAGLVGVLIQGETVVAAERIQPKFSKISPMGGLKRLFSPSGLVEFAKSIAKVTIVGLIALAVARRAVTGIWQGPGIPPEALAPYIARYVSYALLATTAFLLPLALADMLWTRFSWLRNQRMTFKEIRDEHKENEGDPMLKGRRRNIARRRARQRMAQAVPKATLILTNPTHFAVALRYEHAVDAAPVCVAKGADLTARRIREIARENDIPIIENKPLARVLYDKVEVDETVPIEHWQAVAEIVGYVLDLRRNIRRKPPAGSELRREA